MFNGLQGLEQRMGREAGGQLGDSVEVVRPAGVYWRTAVQGRYTHQARAGQRIQRQHGGAQGGLPVTQVGTQPDKYR
ncbi:hypothetical protein D3C71_2078930 [compost metagenome]